MLIITKLSTKLSKHMCITVSIKKHLLHFEEIVHNLLFYKQSKKSYSHFLQTHKFNYLMNLNTKYYNYAHIHRL